MKRILKSILLMIVICCLAGCSTSKENKENKTTENNKVENKEITLNFSNGERKGIYTGEIKEGIPQGAGTFKSQNDEEGNWTYTGEWKQGVMDGTGVCEWEDGRKYEGAYKGGLTDGDGKWYQDGRLLYSGTFSEGRLMKLNREVVKIADSEPIQYVQMGEIGFKIPKSWSYNVADSNTVYVNIPDAENVGIVYSASEKLDLNDKEIRVGLKNQYISEYGKDYSEYKVVSEKFDSGVNAEYYLHLTFYSGDILTDVYCDSMVRGSNTYTLTIVQSGGNYDYSEAAMCIKNTMLKWEYIQEDIAESENEQENKNIMKLLEGDIDWTGLEASIPKAVGQDFVDYTYKEKIVLVEGIIDNISKNKFDVWIPHDGSYMKIEDWNYDINPEDLPNGSTIEICVETHRDGSLKTSEGVLAIRKMDVPVKEDMVGEFKNSCKNLEYKNILRNPDKFRGTIWKANGIVFQVVETKDYAQKILLQLDDGNILYVSYLKNKKADNVLENDSITVYGTFYMTETYTTVLNESKTIPRLTVDYVDIK